MIFNNVLTAFAALTGFAAFASVLVSALKLFGVVNDGNSAKVVASINFIGIPTFVRWLLESKGYISKKPVVSNSEITLEGGI